MSCSSSTSSSSLALNEAERRPGFPTLRRPDGVGNREAWPHRARPPFASAQLPKRAVVHPNFRRVVHQGRRHERRREDARPIAAVLSALAAVLWTASSRRAVSGAASLTIPHCEWRGFATRSLPAHGDYRRVAIPRVLHTVPKMPVPAEDVASHSRLPRQRHSAQANRTATRATIGRSPQSGLAKTLQADAMPHEVNHPVAAPFKHRREGRQLHRVASNSVHGLGAFAQQSHRLVQCFVTTAEDAARYGRVQKSLVFGRNADAHDTTLLGSAPYQA